MANTFKIKEEPKPEVVEEVAVEQPSKAMPKPVGAVFGFLGGSFLSRDTVIKQIPFVLFLAFIAMCYIANGYYAERMIREIGTTEGELKELHSEYITTKSDLMHISKQSEVAKASALYGIKESTAPPKKLVSTVKVAATK